MRDEGLNEAIGAAGSVSELARRLSIAQPPVSNWFRIPTERVLAVEAATGVPCQKLRPDLFAMAQINLDDVDAARAREYALLATLLDRAPDADLLARLGRLQADPSPLGLAHAALAQAAEDTSVERVNREYFDLFIGIGRGELLPYASYYLTGFLHERPLARLRGDLAVLGIARAEDKPEPEDHAGILCAIMAGLIGGEFEAAPGRDREIFEKHMKPWIGRLFADLEQASAAEFYRSVGRVGRVFFEIECEAFALPS